VVSKLANYMYGLFGSPVAVEYVFISMASHA